MTVSVAIGNMLWRIGGILDIDEQLAWCRRAGFRGVGFHASAGEPGVWRGVEPGACCPATRARLRSDLAAFDYVEVHAPFAVELRHDTLRHGLMALGPVFDLAADVGAHVVTVHAQPQLRKKNCKPTCDWLPAMRELDAAAKRSGVTVALEITDGFDEVKSWNLRNVGVNLDVGHMYTGPSRCVLDGAGGIGGLIRHIGDSLVHLHLHDVVDQVDHCEIGTGVVDFHAVAHGLADISYDRGITLELNPGRVTPAGIRRSLKRLTDCLQATAIA